MSTIFKQSPTNSIKSLSQQSPSFIIELQEDVNFQKGLKSLTAIACKQAIKIRQTGLKGVSLDYNASDTINLIKVELV